MTTQDTSNLPPLLTEQQAAELSGVAYRTWHRWSRSGLAPPPIKIGHGVRPAIRFGRDEILTWIAGGCKPVRE